MQQHSMSSVADIVGLGYMQQIQDSLGSKSGIVATLLDPKGMPLPFPSNIHSFCALVEAANFNEPSDNALVRHSQARLCVATIPIVMKGKRLGSWLIGQVGILAEKRETRRIPSEVGLSTEDALSQLKLIPRIPTEQLDHIMSFFKSACAAIANLVGSSYRAALQSDALMKFDYSDQAFDVFRTMINASHVGFCAIDCKSECLVVCNDMYRKTFETEEEELLEKACVNVLPDSDGSHSAVEYMEAMQASDVEVNSWDYYHAKSNRWFSVDSQILPWIDGRCIAMTMFSDISQQKAEENYIAYLAYHDQRLEIPNGVKLAEDLKNASSDTYMICFDVQGLRKINDIYGRDAGDSLLKSIVGWFKNIPSSCYELYRIEGDDFVAIMKNVDEEKAMAFAEYLQERFDQAWDIKIGGIPQSLYAGVHVGVIKVLQPLKDQSAIHNLVERVMSLARKEGKPIFFDERMNEEIKSRMQLEVRLKYCVLNGMLGFSLVYQPIVIASTGQWVGLEALCRWTDEKLGTIPPGVFIEVAEQLGLISMISDWVMEEALTQVKSWKLDELPFFMLDINLSPLQLGDKSLLPKTLALLDKCNYPPVKLSLEITETSQVNFDEKTIKVLNEIRETGISLSLDDFGSGYATFSNLKNIPVGSLKTDRSFVNGLEDDDFLQQTTRIMFDFAKAAGMESIAEGVETELQRDIVEKNGVTMIQGFYFSKPLCKEELDKQLFRFKG